MGHWKNGLKDGSVSIYYTDGAIFRGNYKQGKRLTQGTFTNVKIPSPGDLPLKKYNSSPILKKPLNY